MLHSWVPSPQLESQVQQLLGISPLGTPEEP